MLRVLETHSWVSRISWSVGDNCHETIGVVLKEILAEEKTNLLSGFHEFSGLVQLLFSHKPLVL
jgi:hypothetical protein